MSTHASPFDAIKRYTPQGIEYWNGRDLARLLGYKDWRNFTKAVAKAIEACEQSGRAPSGDFAEITEIVKAGATSKPREDYQLSRYACYLVIQNADPAKPIVALGQTYFAVQTRKQELAEQLAGLDEDQKRIIYRNEMAIFNRQLAETAQMAGVIEPFDFAIFQDHGYKGLYAGEGRADIAELERKERKRLKGKPTKTVTLQRWRSFGFSE
jgi:DNA-damage-inducible protein D